MINNKLSNFVWILNRNSNIKHRLIISISLVLLFATQMVAEDGSRLWLRQEKGANAQVIVAHSRQSPTLDIAVDELQQAWHGAPVTLSITKDKPVQDGFSIRQTDGKLLLTSPTDIGLLYNAYHLLHLQETGQLNCIATHQTENPTYHLRILNHWNNMNRTVERGYTGQSLWNWEELPETLSDRYQAYTRANASIGINGSVVNNVNASPQRLFTVDNELSSSMINTVYQNKNGIIWIATEDGLPGNVICVIVEDKNHEIWISTSYGVARFNPQHKNFISYYANDGLQGNEFRKGAVYVDNRGEKRHCTFGLCNALYLSIRS